MSAEPATPFVAAAWSPAERESFFAAIARHRRAAWRVALVSHGCAALLALVVAVLMAPLLYAVAGLLLAALHRVVPTPDLIGSVTATLATLTDDPRAVPAERWLSVALAAAAPGLVLMALALAALGRVMREAMSGDAINFAARPPRPGDLGEQRFDNVVAEMAVAAGVPAPRVLIADTPAANAAAVGGNDGLATLVVSSGLLAALDRAELQGVAAHLVGSIANGDMAIGARVATVLGLFGLTSRLSESFGDRAAAGHFARLVRAALRVGGSPQDVELALALTNPLEPAPRGERRPAPTGGKADWRTVAWLPLAGPLVISGFFGGMVAALLLGPLLALSWRQRKYLADATAVQLTRDPQALAGALAKMRGLPAGGGLGPWIGPLAVVASGSGGTRSLLGGSGVAMAPSLERRLRALGALGAGGAAVRPGARLPAWAWVALAPLGALVAGLLGFALYLLLMVSVALSGLFTWLPAVLLNHVLR